jgi:adenosylmethionine-8-amino-7-oxononanoate aminotransferase
LILELATSSLKICNLESAISIAGLDTMSDFIILGTDTDVGKTTFALLWLAAYPEEFTYWKPVESGASDTEKVRALVPQARCLPAGMHFARPVAPPLAAAAEGRSIPDASEFAGMKPRPEGERHLLIETFGGPMSPLNDHELQIALIRQFGLPALLVSSSALGTITRTLKCLYALKHEHVQPFATVLLGERDDYAAKQIARYGLLPVFPLARPRQWDSASIRTAAMEQRGILQKILDCLRNCKIGAVPAISGPGEVEASQVCLLAEAPTPAVPRCAANDAATSASFLPESDAELLARDARTIWHPYTSLRDPEPPLPVVSAQDEFLYLADGTRLIDGISSWWTILHGHRHPVLIKALAEATGELDHVHFAGVTHRHAVRLAELLLSTAPWSGGRVFYSDNGSTAVEVALKMAYQFWCHRGEPQRTLFVGFEHGYHGDTFGAMAASRDPIFFGRFEPLLFQTEIVPIDANRLDEILTRRRAQVAAIIIEPLVQAAGGMRLHSPEELKALFDVSRRHGVLFIADEAMTGGGRLGSLWAHHLAGIAPDLICAAKTLTGGVLPLAATLVAPQIVTVFDSADPGATFFHGHSFTAHPLACAVAAANWQLLTAAPLEAPARMETLWQNALGPLREQPQVRDVRIRGSLAAIELDRPGSYLSEVGRRMRQICRERGVLLRPLGNVLYTLPPLCTSRESLEQIAAAMSAAIEGIKEWRRPP